MVKTLYQHVSQKHCFWQGRRKRTERREEKKRREEDESIALESILYERKVWRIGGLVSRYRRRSTSKKKETTGMKQHDLVDVKTQEQFDFDMQDMQE